MWLLDLDGFGALALSAANAVEFVNLIPIFGAEKISKLVLAIGKGKTVQQFSSQQRADLLLSQWQLLWPLPAAERIKRIEEIAKDYEFEETLGLIAIAMLEPSAPEPFRFDWEKVGSVAASMSLNIGIIAMLGIIGWEIFRP